MRFKTHAKRMICGFMSAVMLLGNVASGMTVYAVEPIAPVNPDGTTPNGNKPQDTAHSEGTYVNDTPLRLQVSKVKTEQGGHEGLAPDNTDADQEDTITYRLSGRVNGSESELIGKYGNDNVELAYSGSGIYLGYGWMKGTLEYLLNRQAQGLDEDVQIIYNEYGVFAGYGYITRKLATADDVNRYVAGADMTLYDAVEIFRNPEVTTDGKDLSEDDRFTGVTVIRDEGSGNVTSAYVNKGYAGTQVMYVLQKDDETLLEVDVNGNVIDRNYNYRDEINDTGEGTWVAKRIQREDTPILFYSLDNLRITSNDTYVSRGSENDKMIDETFGKDRMEGRLYGFDKDGNVVDVTQKDELDFSVYAFEAGTNIPVYEFTSGDYSQIEYDMPEKRIRVGEGMVMYHLDENGNRDSMVDPQTGIAYIEEKIEPAEGHDNIHDVNDTASTADTKIFVWPVNVFRDGSGASSGNANGSATFQKIVTTRIATINADTENEYTIGTLKDGIFVKSMNPVLDQYGHPVYYRQSDETYVKGEDTWDYDGDEYTGFVYHDRLDTENENSYSVNDHDKLYNGDADDPFDQSTHYQYSAEQSVKVTVDTDGNYIVNGADVVPTPVREGYVFGGWLMDPNDLTDGCTLNAWWRNKNNSMDESEREQWYSDREATGATKTLTVKFNANGGEFRHGTGDIHSTDNILYRRLGDAYIMENVWTTGENTPNDPFDEQLVDTIENTAVGAGTISGTGETGNDVYSSTTAGGQADMLKRVNNGAYIMEETKAPVGYAKAFPVGVTMNEHTELQYAEMTDETIKVEFIKRDAADSFEHDIYIDGELQASPDGTHVTVYEPKGSYSYTHVPGAVLSLKAADDATKQAFSDWVKVTANTDITKKEENGFYYLEFFADKPLFLEGIPAGKYILSETVTPDGFVTIEDQKITITGENGVQIFEMNDDHTKVEIEKFYNDGNGNQMLPNAYRATLALADEDGDVIAEWKTDDLSDYTNEISLTKKKSFFSSVVDFFTGKDDTDDSFVENFTSRINAGETDFTSISWTVTREAVLSSASTEDNEIWIVSDGSRYTCTDGTPQADAPETFKQAYATRNQEERTFTYTEEMSAEKDEAESRNLSDQIWNVSNGSKIHICVYGGNDIGSNGRQEYKVDYKFNYRDDYEGVYSNTVSYDTLEERHRFDYLPAGVYKLKEAGVPDGFVGAPDRTITVEETDDVQRFTVENKRRQLEIGKIAKIDDMYFAGMEHDTVITSDDAGKAAVMYGAELTLYYSSTQIPDYEEAFKDGNVPAGVTQVDCWISGSDGVYTESDLHAEIITEDQVGDYKPHVITDISNGWYYLAETETPDYYKTMPVKEIAVTDNTTSDTLTEIRAVNIPMPLEVKVYKRNEAGSLLAGAVFEVKNKTLGGTDVGTFSTGEDGYGKLLITETGRFGKDGAFEPYTFTVQEISAPAGYQINPEIHEFSMASDVHEGIAIIQNKNDGDIVDGVLYVDDDESAITISKSDFSTGEAVPGTKLSVYEAKYDGEKWKSTGKQDGDDWTWTLSENEMTHTVTGLEAGKAYVIVEEEVPAGYTLADDVFFKVAASGTAIEKIWYDPEENAFISFESDSTGAVESVTFSTRTIMGTYVTLEDIESGDTSNMGTLTGGYVNFSDSDVTDGRRYRMTEHVRYSDGSEDRLSTTTFIAKLYNGLMKVELTRELKDLTVDITDDAGKSVVSFKPDRTGSYTVSNPLVSDPDSLTVTGTLLHKEGVNHEAVQAGDQIRYLIKYQGTGKEIVLMPDDNLEYIRLDALQKESDGNYHFVTEQESGEMTIVATVKENASGYINQRVSIDGKAYSYVNPIAVNHGDGVFSKTSKLVLSNEVAGTHPDNANAAFTFRVTLTKADGSPLDGGYDFRTRYTNGMLKAFGSTSEFEFTLNGNDFIVIQDLPYNTNYSVVEIVPSDYDFTVKNTEPSGKTSETKVSNVLFTNTRNANAERSIFKKNTGYILSENLNFADDKDPMVITRYKFSFGEKCEIKDIGILNKPTEVWFSKTDWTDSEEVPGAHCVLMDEQGNVIKDELGNPVEWISGNEPKKFKGILEAGKTYRYHEEAAPDGYGYSEDVIFTVSEDGTIDKVVMQDKPTVAWFAKEDFAGKEIPGAHCELKEVEEDGTQTVIASWMSGSEPHKIEGSMTGGKTYIYHEAKAPDGYLYSEDIMFTLDKDGKVVNAHYVNENGETLLYDKDGYVTAIVKHADGSYTENGEAVHIDENGNAVDTSGNIRAEGVKEQIDVVDNVIRMKDAPTDVVFKKKDLHTGESLAGVTLELYKGPKKEPGASYNPTDKIAEWTTDDSGMFRLDGKLTPGETYTLRESKTIDGYYYSYDVEFTVKDTRDEQIVEMYNRKIVVEVPPDELPPDEQEPDGTNPNYEMKKERVTDAPEKTGTDKFGFYAGDVVTYDVTIKNTGSTRLTMNVTDSFEHAEYFSQPAIRAIRYYVNETGRMNSQMGQTHSINGSVANLTIERGGYAVVTYEATVLESTPENLASTAPDNGEGYLNTAKTYDVVGKYYEYSGEDHDGDGKGDEVTEKEIHDHPNLPDKEDDANTPVQEPEGEETPRYVMSKSRPTPAPEKEGTDRYGFKRGDTVTYEVHIRNTGNMPLKMYVTDEFDFSIRKYFKDLKIARIDGGENISESGMGIGYKTARVRIMPGEEVIVTYTAVVTEDAPERLAFMPSDDGNGYLNTAKTFNVKAEKPDGTEGGKEEYPGIPNQEDDGHTPVQTDEEEPPELPPAPEEENYPIIWLLKTGVDDPSHILAGGTFQVLDKDGNIVLEITDTDENGFGIGYDWKQWSGVLKADETYYLHEVTPPPGYTPAKEDVKFTVGHYGEKVEAIVTNERIPDYQFTKEDFAGVEIPGASCELVVVKPDGKEENVGKWTSDGTPKSFKGELKTETTYRYHEELAPDGYGYSETIEFTINKDGKLENVHYINQDGKPILYDEDGFPTSIVVHEDGTYTDGDDKITIDEDGNAVDKNGEIRAEGVQFEIPVVDNAIRMKDAPTEVLLVKTDTDGAVLTGGLFQILTKNGAPVKAIKDTLIPSTEHDGNILAGEPLIFKAVAGGINYTGQLKSGEEYILRELEAPVGHYDSEDVTFRVPYLNSKSPVRVEMQDKPTEVWFTKTDWTTTEEVPGAHCVLTDEDGNVVVDKDGNRCEWISGTEPKVFKGSLEPGKTYHYHESKAPDGYGYSEDIVFTVNVNGEIEKVEMQDKPTEVLITKYSVDPTATASDAEPVEGAILQIFETNGEPAMALYDSIPDENGNKTFIKGRELIFTSTKEGVNITRQLKADETYILREVKAPAGHKTADDVKFTVSHDGSLIRVDMYDPKTVVRILKTDPNGRAVIGANLEVRNTVNGDLMAEFTTDGKPYVLTGILDVGKTYQLIETKQPDSYFKSEPVTFTVSADDEVTEVVMVDEPVELKLIKVKAGTKEQLNGGKFSVIRKSDNKTIIPEFILNGELTVTGKLNAGETYLFHEIEAPDGYLKSGDVEFTIPLEKPDKIIEIIMENRKKPSGGGGNNGGGGSTPPSVTIKKYDGVTMQALPGAEFTFYDSNGSVYKTVTTDANGYAYITFNTVGTFTYKETKAPAGYEPNEEVYTIQIERTSHLTENIPNYDTPPDVIVTKKDAETGEVISGVRFEITNEDGKVVYTGTTDTYGQIVFSPDEYGAYAVRETSVPNGYKKSDGYITFTVSASGVEGETVFYNTKVDVPPIPDPGKRGEITAWYDNGADGYGKGWFDRDGNWHPFATPAKTGDVFPFLLLFGITAAGIAGLASMKRKERKRNEEK